jgi:multidrug efflux pump subunit AcrA (membrane-fusion protein)
MSLMKLTAGNSPESLREKIAAAQSDMSHAQEALEIASFDFEADPNPANRKRRDSALSELTTAKSWLQSLGAALRRAEDMEARRRQEEAAAAVAARWATVESQAKARRKASVKIEKAFADLSDGWTELKEATSAIWETGVVPEPHGAMLLAGELEHIVRIELYRMGFAWAAPHARLLTDLPTPSAKIQAGNENALGQRK